MDFYSDGRGNGGGKVEDLINGRTPEEIKRRLEWKMSPCPEAECNECKYFDVCDEYPDEERLTKDAIAIIERLESERDAALAKVPRWISVKERLPEADGTYVVYMPPPSEPIITAEYSDSRWDDWEVDITKYVTHWMPLPEPPEVEHK